MTQDRIPLDAGSSRPAMEGETGELDRKALVAARRAYQSAIPEMFHADGGESDKPIEAAIRAYLSALPPSPAVAGVERELVERLSKHGCKWTVGDDESEQRARDCDLAASAISRLVKERDEKQAALQRIADEHLPHVEALEASVAHLTALLAEADEVNRALLDWAEARCPCHDEKPDPCPLCGASAKPGGGHCMSAENTLPRHLLEKLRAARRYQQKREAK